MIMSATKAWFPSSDSTLMDTDLEYQERCMKQPTLLIAHAPLTSGNTHWQSDRRSGCICTETWTVFVPEQIPHAHTICHSPVISQDIAMRWTLQLITPAHGPQWQDWPMLKKYWQGCKHCAPHSGQEEEFPHASHCEECASHADSVVTSHGNAPSTQTGKKHTMSAHTSQRWMTMRAIRTKPYMWHEQ